MNFFSQFLRPDADRGDLIEIVCSSGKGSENSFPTDGKTLFPELFRREPPVAVGPYRTGGEAVERLLHLSSGGDKPASGVRFCEAFRISFPGD